MDRLTASEALFGFCGWLTSQRNPITLGSDFDCSPVVRRLSEYLNANGLSEPRDGWENNLIHPSGCSEAAISICASVRALSDSEFEGMSECSRYGMTKGCDDECPVLLRGECELMDDE